ncbi:glycosyltransferase involved in cell wall biosynthesis [Streptomyces luteogriseus]|uniref:glycosyltransferase family 4 protein n=1 Tax=Streptomyces luteogriseus TaxID=68233 RepID=UPI00277D7BF5|nr:glycosyltransferase family 4 protein [Streptomyces luteogriseus]MDQ0717735.1 glycosyltransferase involved in cell wall biosynthesis [Streptomyces luteogriseus]
MKHRPLMVCVSGPDGAGKSSLAARMTADLRGRGYAVAARYCYGCVVCRRLPQRVRSRFTASPGKPRSIVPDLGMWVGRLHGWVDAAELAADLARARVRARLTSRGRPTAVVTDRGPLDGLVKIDPVPGSRLAAAFARLARTYEITLLLDAEPEVLAERDGEYASGPLANCRDRYRQWAARLPSVRLVDAAASPDAVAAEALTWVPAPRVPRSRPGSGRHVVISTFDDLRNPHYHGGGALLVDKVARRLAEEHRVTVVTVAARGGAEIRDGVRYHRLPLGWAGPRLGQLLYHAVLPVTARRLPHDLWLESFTPPFSTGFLPLFSHGRVVGLAQSLSGAAMSRRYHLPFALVERFGLRFYEDVVTLNETDAATVRRHSPRAVTHVIHNGVDQPPVAPRRIGEGDYIAFLGRVEVQGKGLDLLLAAHAAGAPSMPLLLAGAGPRGEEAGLAALIATTGADARWVGEVTGAEKQRFLDRCAFLVLPSRSESFGLVALEAMAYGKPVLHFDLPTLRWMDGGDIAVPAFDVAALARQLRDLAADERMRRRLGRMAYRTAQGFSWEQTTGQYLALVQRLLGPPGPSRSATEVTTREAKREGSGSWQRIH